MTRAVQVMAEQIARLEKTCEQVEQLLSETRAEAQDHARLIAIIENVFAHGARFGNDE